MADIKIDYHPDPIFDPIADLIPCSKVNEKLKLAREKKQKKRSHWFKKREKRDSVPELDADDIKKN